MFLNCSETSVISWDNELKVKIDMQYGQLADVPTKNLTAREVFDRLMISLDACANTPVEDVVYVPKSLAVAEELTEMLKQSGVKVIDELPTRKPTENNGLLILIGVFFIVSLSVFCFLDCWHRSFQWSSVIMSDIIPAGLFAVITAYIIHYYRHHKRVKKDK